ncbi:MAG TPA: hypothetical protein VGP70_11985 [Actinomadura sp.]|nr:hypothetical protein [Actinomadura sp.]
MSHNSIDSAPTGEQPAPVPDPRPETPGGPRRRGRVIAIAALAALGLAAMSGGGFALAHELTRKPTAKEVEAAGAAELASRWRIRTAGEIFPATVDYSASGGLAASRGKPDALLRARRAGIASAATCQEALDRRVADILVKHHCRTMLRATYLDASGTLVTTLGIAVMPSPDAADAVESEFNTAFGTGGNGKDGLRGVGFTGTVAEGFGDRQRQELWLGQNRTPYVFFHASGWADGRTRITGRERVEQFDFASALSTHLMTGFVRADRPCETRGVRC